MIVTSLTPFSELKDSEALINYQMNLADSPDWYSIVWIRFQKEYKKASDASILRILDRYYENSGKRVQIPDTEELVMGRDSQSKFGLLEV